MSQGCPVRQLSRQGSCAILMGTAGAFATPKQYDSLRGELWKRLLHQTALCGTDGGTDSFHAVSSRIFKRLG
jgi:hypothetical protein